MPTIRKFICLILGIIIILSTAACSNQSSDVQKGTDEANQSQSNPNTEGTDNLDSVISLPEPSILGQWVPEDGKSGMNSGSDFWMMDEIELFSDGTGTSENDSFTWIAENGRLKIDYARSSPVTFNYDLKTGYLRLSSEEEREVFVRPYCTLFDLQGNWEIDRSSRNKSFPNKLSLDYISESDIEMIPYWNECRYISLNDEKTSIYFLHGASHVFEIAQLNCFNPIDIENGDLDEVLEKYFHEDNEFENAIDMYKQSNYYFVSNSELYLVDIDTQEIAKYIRAD